MHKSVPYSLSSTCLVNRYIRYIYNRVILENATVRAAAVSALARFGALCDDLLGNILVLLTRCMMDNDDEVRDRATYFKAILEQQQQNLNSQFILNGLQVHFNKLHSDRAYFSYYYVRCLCHHWRRPCIPTPCPPARNLLTLRAYLLLP